MLRGSSETGLIAKVERIMPMVEELHIAVMGTSDRPGLLTRILQLEKAGERWAKPLWLVGSLLITALLTWVIDKLVH
jgi:hypothetical protein